EHQVPVVGLRVDGHQVEGRLRIAVVVQGEADLEGAAGGGGGEREGRPAGEGRAVAVVLVDGRGVAGLDDHQVGAAGELEVAGDQRHRVGAGGDGGRGAEAGAAGAGEQLDRALRRVADHDVGLAVVGEVGDGQRRHAA